MIATDDPDDYISFGFRWADWSVFPQSDFALGAVVDVFEIPGQTSSGGTVVEPEKEPPTVEEESESDGWRLHEPWCHSAMAQCGKESAFYFRHGLLYEPWVIAILNRD